ncbi:unnamed protein product [Paramecium octaurelia]|uniref:Uncharacterized protein n=1 Tax=Paramecium octaurelia TaxID=43137 RepID=A0A8S1X1Z3_PAROT|nr:unnamed protein product [Paramecium octaurelia]
MRLDHTINVFLEIIVRIHTFTNLKNVLTQEGIKTARVVFIVKSVQRKSSWIFSLSLLIVQFIYLALIFCQKVLLQPLEFFLIIMNEKQSLWR